MIFLMLETPKHLQPRVNPEKMRLEDPHDGITVDDALRPLHSVSFITERGYQSCPVITFNDGTKWVLTHDGTLSEVMTKLRLMREDTGEIITFKGVRATRPEEWI